jgi:hypothetical protein
MDMVFLAPDVVVAAFVSKIINFQVLLWGLEVGEAVWIVGPS